MEPVAESSELEKAGPELDFRLLVESAPGLFVAVLADAPTFTIVVLSDAYLQTTKKIAQRIG
jgi:hypothetical protein